MDRRATWASALAALSAAAATTHEVAWSRLLARVVGNTSWGIGLALGLFLVGMGLGGLLARRLLSRLPPRRGYVASELIIGAGAAISHAFAAYGPIPSAIIGGGIATDLLACVALTLPATLAIGATYPFLVGAIADASERPRAVGALYLAGLLGGVGGVVLAGFVLVPRAGADVAGFGAAIANVLVAVAASRALPRGEPIVASPSAPTSLARPLALFASAGALGLGAQLVWNRAIAPYAGVSVFTFSCVVAIYLLAQSLGFAIQRRSERELGAWAAALVPAVLLVTLGLAPSLAGAIPPRDSGLAWLGTAIAVVATAVLPGALLLGVVQASALRELESMRGDWARSAAVVTGAGTALSALAGIAVSLLLYGALGPRVTIAILGAPIACVLLASAADRARGGASIIAIAIALAIAPGPAHFLGADYDGADILSVSRGAQDTTAIVLHDSPVEPRVRHLVANGVAYSGDSLFAQRYMRLLGHLPALAASRRDRALVICLGTGSTAGALLSHPFERVDAVDISPSIEESLAYFAHVHGGLPTDPRAHIVVDDGLRFLATSQRRRWDVITMEPPPPRAPGASSLYSREMYELARDHLADGGAIAQWLPLHGLTAAELDAIVRTFVGVFPDSSLHLVERNEAILLGRMPAPQPEQRQPGPARRDESRADLATIGFDGVDPIADTMVADGRTLARLTRGAATITYAWPMPELTPLHGRDAEPVDAWLERLARASDARGTSGAILLRIAPSFVRVREGRARRGDRERATAGLVAWLARDPGDAYVQHAFGYGPLLERRLERVEVDDATRARVLARMAAQADSARELLEAAERETE